MCMRATLKIVWLLRENHRRVHGFDYLLHIAVCVASGEATAPGNIYCLVGVPLARYFSCVSHYLCVVHVELWIPLEKFDLFCYIYVDRLIENVSVKTRSAWHSHYKHMVVC